MTPHALVFGASGQVGAALLARLHAAGWQVTALTRGAHADADGLRWLRGDFEQLPPLPARADAVFSCGPLDLFARWYAQAEIEAPRVVAFGSTSAEVKSGSNDAGERDLAARLQQGEDGVLASAQRRGAAATLLRPTLVYGAGRDQTLSRIASMARRWGRMVLPRGAHGLRQPVHVDDLAQAALAALASAGGQTYALGGGETLPYRAMVARVLACLHPPPALVEVPGPLFALALKLAQSRGIATGLGSEAVARMRRDLVFDLQPARRDLGYAPRAFRPAPSMFPD